MAFMVTKRRETAKVAKRCAGGARSCYEVGNGPMWSG